MTSRMQSGPPIVFRPGSRVVAIYLLAALAQVGAVIVLLATPDPGQGSAWRSLPLDDAWIHLVYARSVAERLAFEYNRGVSEAGMTSPGWVVVLAGFLRIGGLEAPAQAAKLASLLFAVLALLGAMRLADRLAGLTAAIITGIVLLALASWHVDAASGMEVTATAAILVWLGESLYAGRRWLAVVLLAVLPLFRPEGMAVAIVAAGLASLQRDKDRLVLWQRLAASWTPLCLAIGSWIGYHLTAVGRPLPNTFYAKVETTTLNPLDSLPYLGVSYGVPLMGGSTAAWWLLVGAVVAGTISTLRRGPIGLIASTVGPMFGFAVLIVRPLPATALDFTGSRYLDPALPGLIALAGVGASLLVRRIPGPTFARGVVTVLGAALLLSGPLSSWPEARRMYAGSTSNIEEVDEAIGRWLAGRLQSGARVATFDAGAIKWFLPDHEVIDVLGLNTAWAVRQPLAAVLDRERPDYLVYWSLPVAESLRVIDQAQLRIRPEHNYILGGDEATVWTLRYDVPELPPSRPLASSLNGWVVRDQVDVGDVSNENDHRYQSNSLAVRRDSSRVGNGGFTSDEGRIVRTGEVEQFTLEGCPGGREALVIRYDGRSAGAVEFSFNGTPPSTVNLEPSRTILTEALIPVPARSNAEPALTVRVRPIQSPSGFFAAYRYWLLVGSPGC